MEQAIQSWTLERGNQWSEQRTPPPPPPPVPTENLRQSSRFALDENITGTDISQAEPHITDQDAGDN